ncbi:hypothetical protein PoB_000681500 [Plakobranchus ocellatus]|uniref:Uncharacterized protein n=1 Tax=Plakobranchus ocellatus TaxID=259542 RepID=A0AAV3YC24_9GAST|nr:hypothetical protein PoB_000681500 [Plakobranchus ocellatus]
MAEHDLRVQGQLQLDSVHCLPMHRLTLSEQCPPLLGYCPNDVQHAPALIIDSDPGLSASNLHVQHWSVLPFSGWPIT